MMKPYRVLMALVLVASLVVPGVAQEKAKTDGADKAAEVKKTITPLRIQVVFNEFDGDKRITSLPYTLMVNADTAGPIASIRMGLRVPIRTSANTSTYMDMGTNIDGRAEKQEDGKFLVSLSVERSSTYAPQSHVAENNQTAFEQPVIQQFRSQLNLLMREGQTVPSTVSTDPLTGHVIKVDVTVNVAK
jgi:hypothetical protein